MPDSVGNFKGISVPRLPWLEEPETVVVCDSCSSPLCARGSEVCDDFLFAGLVNVLAPSGDDNGA